MTPEERAALDRAILEAYRREGHRAGGAGDARPGAPAAGRPARRPAGRRHRRRGRAWPGCSTATSPARSGACSTGRRTCAWTAPSSSSTCRTSTGTTRCPTGLRAAVIRLVTSHVWRTVRRERRPRLFVADEAATLLEHEDSARFVGNVARRCRKYWLGLCVAVQRLDHLRGSPAGLDVLANAGAKFLLGHRSEDVGPVVQAFGLSDADRTDLVTAPRGHGLFLTRAGRAFVEVLASPEEHRLYTTRPDEVAADRGRGAGARARRRGPPGTATPRRPWRAEGRAAMATRAEPARQRATGHAGRSTGSTGGCTPASGWRPSSGPWSPGPPPPPPWPWRCPCAPCGGRSRAGGRRGSPRCPPPRRRGGLGGRGRPRTAAPPEVGADRAAGGRRPARRGLPGRAGRVVRLRRRGRPLAAGHPRARTPSPPGAGGGPSSPPTCTTCGGAPCCSGRPAAALWAWRDGLRVRARQEVPLDPQGGRTPRPRRSPPPSTGRPPPARWSTRPPAGCCGR